MSAVETRGNERKQDRTRFWVDVPFEVKAAAGAAKGDLVLKGYASTWVADRDGERVDPKAFDNDLAGYMENPIILWQHNQDWAMGQVTDARVDEKGLYVECFIAAPIEGEEPWRFTAYNLIRRGVVKTFSIGGFFYRTLNIPLDDESWDDPMFEPEIVINRVELFEVSAVSIPSNPDSLFGAAVKSLKGAANGPVVVARASNQMAQLIGMDALADSELKAMTEEERDERYFDLIRLYRRAGLVPPTKEMWADVVRVGKQVRHPAELFALTLGPMLHLHGMVKVGRVLSKENEDKLQSALLALQEVLSKVAVSQEVPDEAEAALAALADAAGVEVEDKKGATTFKDLALGDRGEAWDGNAAQTAMSPEQYPVGHFWKDPEGDAGARGSYKLPFAKPTDNGMKAVWGGVTAAAGRLGQASIPEGDVSGVQNHIARYYSKAASQYGDDSIQPPWKKSADYARRAMELLPRAKRAAEAGRVVARLSSEALGVAADARERVIDMVKRIEEDARLVRALLESEDEKDAARTLERKAADSEDAFPAMATALDRLEENTAQAEELLGLKDEGDEVDEKDRHDYKGEDGEPCGICGKPYDDPIHFGAPEKSAGEKAVECPVCGEDVPDTATYCPNCGHLMEPGGPAGAPDNGPGQQSADTDRLAAKANAAAADPTVREQLSALAARIDAMATKAPEVRLGNYRLVPGDSE